VRLDVRKIFRLHFEGRYDDVCDGADLAYDTARRGINPQLYA
jgi:hypothetical protein